MLTIITQLFEKQKRNYGQEFYLANKELYTFYLNEDFDLDDLYKYGFGWCDNYTRDKDGNLAGAYELFVDSVCYGEIRVYYIPCENTLLIEIMDSKNVGVLIHLFLSDLEEIGMINRTYGKEIHVKCD